MDRTEDGRQLKLLTTLLVSVDTGVTNDPRVRRSGSWGLGGNEHMPVALHYGEAEGR